VLSPESVALRILREVKKDAPRFCGRQLALAVSLGVGHEILGVRKPELDALAEELGATIEVHARPALHQEQFEVTALDQGPPVDLALRWLEEPKPDEPEEEEAELAVDAALAGAETIALVVPDSEADSEPTLATSLQGELESFSALDWADDEDASQEPEATPPDPQEPLAVEPPQAESETDPAPEQLDDAGESRILPPSRNSPAEETAGEVAPAAVAGGAATDDEGDDAIRTASPVPTATLGESEEP
jgi:hypothetical protein